MKKKYKRKKKDSITEQVEKYTKKKVFEDTVEFINTGSTLLNLAVSGKGQKGGWARGRIINLVGDGSSGKTLLALETSAQAFYNLSSKSKLFPEVKKLSIVYNNVEGVMDFPLEKMYGEEFKKAVEWKHSDTCERFGRDFMRRVNEHKSGEFLLYILDSIDALGSEKGRERIQESIKGDREEKGSYGVEKAKYFSSSFFQEVCSSMKDKDITLICISQIRQKIGVTFGERYYRCGGKALDFYTHQVVWLRECKKLKKTFKGQDRICGVKVHAKVKRNKVAKPFREAEFDILFDYGIDDIGSLVGLEFPKAKNKKELIKSLEQSPEALKEVIENVERNWNEVEEAIKPDRKKRFV